MIDRLIILIPTKDDHEVLRPFIDRLASVLTQHGLRAHLLLIDDASHQPVTASSVDAVRLEPGLRLTILRLRRNLGHQRAIAVGLAYIHDQLRPERIVVMDGDGEDQPEDVPRLLAELDRNAASIVFGERTRRSESLVFKSGYYAYRILHRLLTGISVKFGNFSVIPAPLVSPLVVGSELWNHYAAAVLKLGLPFRSIPTARGLRIAGESRMDIVRLIVHGLSAISVFGDIVGVRLLMVTSALGALLVGLLGTLLGVTVLTSIRLPERIVAVVGIALVLLVQLGIVVLGFVFVILGSRASTNVIPLRDYRWFLEGETTTTASESSG